MRIIYFCIAVIVSSAGADSLKEQIPFQKFQEDFVAGTLNVAIDPATPHSGDRLTISYRILGASHTNRPILVFVGGGPGLPSIDSYFDNDQERNGLLGYSQYFRVLVFDQRGVGKSSPVEADSEKLTAELVMRYFGAEAHAFDVAQLIAQKVKPGESFFIMGHSYGGKVIERYMVNDQFPKPAGVFLVSTLSTQVPIVDFLVDRAEVQIAQNQRLLSEPIRQKIRKIRESIANNQIDLDDNRRLTPGDLNVLFEMVDERDLPVLESVLDELLSAQNNPAPYRRLLGWRLKRTSGSRLACLISACDLSNPLTDHQATSAAYARLAERLEDWMLTEAGLWHNPAVIVSEEELASALPLFPPVEMAKLRESFAGVPLIALAGDQDSYISLRTAEAGFKLLASEPIHHFEPLEGGGHVSGLVPQVADFAVDLCRRMLASPPSP